VFRQKKTPPYIFFRAGHIPPTTIRTTTKTFVVRRDIERQTFSPTVQRIPSQTYHAFHLRTIVPDFRISVNSKIEIILELFYLWISYNLVNNRDDLKFKKFKGLKI